MNTIVINGKTFQVEGKNVSIVNNNVLVDGKVVNTDELKNEITIKWEGDLANLDCKNAYIKGNIHGDVDSHNVEITGNVSGNVDSHNTDIKGNVGGNVKGHNIKVDGDVHGDRKEV